MLQDIPEEDRKQEPKKYSEMREEGGMKKEDEEEGARRKKGTLAGERGRGQQATQNLRSWGGAGGSALLGNGRCDDVSDRPVSLRWMRSSWPPQLPTTGSLLVSKCLWPTGRRRTMTSLPRQETSVPKEC